MKKLALMAGAGLLALCGAVPAQAQRFYDDDGWGSSRRIVRERVVVRHAPIVRQQVIVHRAPVIRERIVYRAAPVIRQRIVYAAPVVRQRVAVRPARVVRKQETYRRVPIVRRAPVARTQQVVYREAPVVRTRQVVYRAAPVVRQRIVYEQPRVRIVSQPAYSTRVTFREPRRERVMVRSVVRDDIGDRWERRAERRMMRGW